MHQQKCKLIEEIDAVIFSLGKYVNAAYKEKHMEAGIHVMGMVQEALKLKEDTQILLDFNLDVP